MKALIVDDSISVRKALERILNTRDIVTLTAGSAEEAITVLPHSEAEIIITDVVMPGMSGFDLCRHIKASDMSHLPVVLISGVVDDEVNAQAARAGASMIVTKPFTPEELFPKLEAALAGDTLAKQLGQDDELLVQEDDAISAEPVAQAEPVEEIAPIAEAEPVADTETPELEDMPEITELLEPEPDYSVAAEQSEQNGQPPVEPSYQEPSYQEPSYQEPSYEVLESPESESDLQQDDALFAEGDAEDVLPVIAEETDEPVINESDTLEPVAAGADEMLTPELFEVEAPESPSDISAEAEGIEAEGIEAEVIEVEIIETDAANESDILEPIAEIGEPAMFEPEPVTFSEAANAEAGQSDDELLLFLEEDYVEPEPVIQEGYVNLPTPQFDGPLSPEALSELGVFLRHPSVRSALVVNKAGSCIASEGEESTDADSLASYVNTLVSIASVLGGKLGSEALSHFHLEYDGASLVLFKLDAEHRLLLSLTDSDSLGVLHYLVRRYIENAGEAALAK